MMLPTTMMITMLRMMMMMMTTMKATITIVSGKYYGMFVLLDAFTLRYVPFVGGPLIQSGSQAGS